ncbi:site-specific integrase [Rubrivirga marina]|uniref:Tyr recombinase domain-containing protein n=1 Tax=Rubrivirga marina TaxID=1196024 RepID=A0A271IVD1_9BACT|nr:site-specific integrase [Rubrivirga marina]PAP75070.1 hypothetical protein BSZ37_00695 [Rubrivirga marina]
MAASVKLVLRTQKTRADGLAPVYLRATANRKSRFTSTGIYVRPRDWNDRRQEVRSSCDLADAYNRRLGELLNDARSAALDASSAGTVVAALTGPAGSATGYFERHVGRLDEAGRYWQHKHFGVTLGHLRAALGQDVLWAELDRDALGRFEAHLRVRAKNAPNTIRNHMKRLRRVVREAIREGELEAGQDPFLTYTPPRAAPVHRRKLTMPEIRALADAELPEGSTEALARDVFLFSFYGAGVRASDLAALRATDVRGGRLRYRMMKTGETVTVGLPPEGRAIAERYAETAADRGGLLFPLITAADTRDPVRLRRSANRANSRINAALKRAASGVEVDDTGLTMHVARHSFADLARRRGGSLFDVSRALGHSSLSTTQAYLASLDQEAADRLAGIMWTDG